MVAVCILCLSLCLLQAYKEVAEFNALCNLADSLPDSSSEEEDLAMETDPRYLISHSLMKALLRSLRTKRKKRFCRSRGSMRTTELSRVRK